MKSIRFRQILTFTYVFISLNAYSQGKLPQFGKDPISQVITAMTLEEKAALVVGTGLRFEGKGPVVGETDGRVPGAAGNTMNISRLGIPGVFLSDGPAGVRIDPYRKEDSSKSFYATAFPVGTLLASSWDTALVRKVGVAFGNEVKEYGIDVILAPGLNIQRDPLNGRNFEYYSEDPIVSGYMAAAMVKGIQSNGVGACIKHFAANNQESNRSAVNAIVSERALREIYLKGFEIAVKRSDPWTVMSSYNKINGTYTSERADLLTGILRNEWGFKGMVMTDWYGGKDAVAQMKAGNDLIEPGRKAKSQAIVDAVNNGTLNVKLLDRNVERILSFLLKTPSFQNYKFSDLPDLKAHSVVARNAAAEGMVLLKNEHDVLPLKKGAKVSLYGNASYKTIIGGTGSGQVNVAYSVSIAEGLENAGLITRGDLKKSYIMHIEQDKVSHPKTVSIIIGTPRMAPELAFSTVTIEQAAKDADIAIFTIGRNAGEGADRKILNNFNISDSERILIKSIADAFHARGKPMIVILNIGGAIETTSWRDNADAILLAWQPGLEAGNAVADILTGIINPSGKLAATFPVKYEDEPTAKNFPGTPANNPTEVVYEEGIYVGYRYYNTFNVKPAYEFGYGLSYTNFSYSNMTLSSPQFNDSIKASITITNSGKVPGKEAVQLYISAPAKGIDKPAEELKAFSKTGLLNPGASQTISFTLTAQDFASFNAERSAWISDAGNYIVKIGASSENIKAIKTFLLSKSITVETVNKSLEPQVPINELKNNASK